jgi:hypothetical protein
MRPGFVARSSHHLPVLATVAIAALLLVPRTAPAATDACSLLKAGDVAALVGASPACKPAPRGTSCAWTGAKAGRKVIVLTYAAIPGVPPEAAYMGARRQSAAGGDAKIADEAGIGERAFSGQVSFGAVMVALKQGRMIQLQYWTGSKGTSADVAALRPVMRKAVAAF